MKGILKKASEDETAAAIREAIGAGPNEQVTVVTPQFERPRGDPAPKSAPDRQGFFDLQSRAPSMTTAELIKLGLRPWGEPEEGDPPLKGCLWLFPGEWYAHIPAGLEIVFISFGSGKFEPGETDNDIRFGCLAFGVMGPIPGAKGPKAS